MTADGVDPLRDVLAGHRGHAAGRGRPGRARAPLTGGSVEAWAQILQVEDWDDDRAERLRALVLE